jgi:hypothetical protein
MSRRRSGAGEPGENPRLPDAVERPKCERRARPYKARDAARSSWRLSTGTYVELIAELLKANAFASGATELEPNPESGR